MVYQSARFVTTRPIHRAARTWIRAPALCSQAGRMSGAELQLSASTAKTFWRLLGHAGVFDLRKRWQIPSRCRPYDVG